jgi:nucleoside-diphosphate-sugar epimerase
MTDIIREDIQNILRKVDISGTFGQTVLLTGASGIIGTYFLALFNEASMNGEGPSRIFAVTKSGSFPSQLEAGKVMIETIKGDLGNRGFCESLPSANIVIHAAGYGQPGKFLADPLLTIELNTAVTSSLVRKVKKNGRFLFFSSSEVYSGISKPPFSEVQIGTTNTNHPRASYIEGKRCGEAIVNSARESSGLNASSIRLALAYGPGTKKNDARALNSFIDQAINLGEIRLQDSGSAWRTYCYISDAIEMSAQILLRGEEDIYNVGGLSRTSILDLAQLIADFSGAKLLTPRQVDVPESGAPDDVWMNIERARALAGKNDFVSLNDGLKKTIAWRKESTSNNTK